MLVLTRYEGWVDLIDIEYEMARLDAVYRPVATQPADITDPDALMDMDTTIQADLARLSVDDQAEAVLRVIVECYTAGDEAVRATIRRLFDRYGFFQWGAHLHRDWSTAAEFRARLVHLSARDQGRDTRDEILTLQDLCGQAWQAGIDIDLILDEVAAMSSDIDRYGMGSTRAVILSYGKRSTD